MPIYAYRCATCGHAQDVLQKISDPLLTDCPACGAATYQKQVTAAGFQLKGSGWYVTDFREGNKGAAKKDAPAEGVKDGAKDDAKEGAKAAATDKAGEGPAKTAEAPKAAAAPAAGAAPAAAPAAAPPPAGA